MKYPLSLFDISFTVGFSLITAASAVQAGDNDYTSEIDPGITTDSCTSGYKNRDTENHLIKVVVAVDRVYDVYVVDAFADDKGTRLHIGDSVYHPESRYSF